MLVGSLLGTDGRIITDLDALFSGKLREVFCNDDRVIQWLEKQEERQQDFYGTIFTQKELAQKITLEKLIQKLEKYLILTGRYICNYRGTIPRKLTRTGRSRWTYFPYRPSTADRKCETRPRPVRQ